jgi:hypothetical protein
LERGESSEVREILNRAHSQGVFMVSEQLRFWKSGHPRPARSRESETTQGQATA